MKHAAELKQDRKNGIIYKSQRIIIVHHAKFYDKETKSNQERKMLRHNSKNWRITELL